MQYVQSFLLGIKTLLKDGLALMLLAAPTMVKHRTQKVVAACILITGGLFIIALIADLKLVGVLVCILD
jgi:hypothetical protein